MTESIRRRIVREDPSRDLSLIAVRTIEEEMTDAIREKRTGGTRDRKIGEMIVSRDKMIEGMIVRRIDVTKEKMRDRATRKQAQDRQVIHVKAPQENLPRNVQGLPRRVVLKMTDQVLHLRSVRDLLRRSQSLLRSAASHPGKKRVVVTRSRAMTNTMDLSRTMTTIL